MRAHCRKNGYKYEANTMRQIGCGDNVLVVELAQQHDTCVHFIVVVNMWAVMSVAMKMAL